MAFSIYLVEDDPWYGELLKHHLSLNPDYEVTLFDNASDCLKNLYQKPDVVCIDFGLPDMSGDKLLTKIKAVDINMPVIVISGQEDIGVAVSLLKNGARDYIIKDDHTKDVLWKSIINVRENTELKKEVEELREQIEDNYLFDNSIIGQSKAIKTVFKHLEKAIKSNINISITGETGTGKELVAKAIHYNSSRKKKPFIAVNMAAIPAELVESELFGHEKGAFTGAVSQKIGKFEAANGGTIFLDEIAELDLNIQSKILRVIQEREVVRVGGNKTISFDARLITATHKDLATEVKEGRFREDLYYRIVGLPVELPPLRNRDQDIILLADYFVGEYAKDNKVKKYSLEESARQKLLDYHFPGNVRELKAVIDLACAMADGSKITGEDITFRSIGKEGSFLDGGEKTLKEYQVDIITHYLQKYNGNVIKVANKLDIGKSTIYNMIKSEDINIKEL
jgi:DNA-binding NtrC family response regulator